MPIDELRERKQVARAQARYMLSKLNPKRRKRAALDVGKALRFSNIWATCDCLLAYMGQGSELDCAPTIQLALDENKKVFIPKILAGSLFFFRILSSDGPFVEGPFGIREPAMERSEPGTGREVWEPGRELSLVLVPGLLFDEDGGRLGRGGGYFDRFIRRCRSSEGVSDVVNLLFVGYAYDEQLVGKVPRGSGDELLDGVQTDLRFLQHL